MKYVYYYILKSILQCLQKIAYFRRQQYQAQEKLEQQLTDALNTIEQHRQTK